MAELTVEDTVILWDCSRSMIRTDFEPSRLRVAQKMIKIFIDQKILIDFKDSIAIATFGSRTKRITEFSNDPEYLKENLSSKLEISGHSNLEDGIAFGLQMLVKQIQKIGGKTPRIMIFTDNSSNYKITNRIKKLAKAARGLKIFIDVCQIGPPIVKKQDENLLKKLVYATNGEYAFFNNKKALYTASEGFASKKSAGKESVDPFNPNKEDDSLVPLISEISVDLRRPTIHEMREMIRGEVEYKCQICFQNKCPVCNSPFYVCGRFCPSCNKPIHLHCASLWAQKSDIDKSRKDVFRCPFCYFLLRIPPSIQRLMALTGGKIKIVDNDMEKPVKMIRVPDNEINGIQDACSFCNNIFVGEQKVFRCTGCNAYYHEFCLQEMFKDIKACRNCGGQIQ
ncbi:MAG: vWA domain-containing protein [Promethearchaeota archaeon]